MTIENHWGVWVDSEKPTTGVLSVHDVAWEWINDDICLTCEEIVNDIENDENLSEDEKQMELEYMECDPSHIRIFGDWIKDEDEKYMPDPNGELAAIENESTVQVVYSKHTQRGALCSPCYPGQVDIGSKGEFLGYTLPPELLVDNDKTVIPDDGYSDGGEAYTDEEMEIIRAQEHTKHASPECQCAICTYGYDEWLRNFHPSEY